MITPDDDNDNESDNDHNDVDDFLNHYNNRN